MGNINITNHQVQIDGYKAVISNPELSDEFAVSRDSVAKVIASVEPTISPDELTIDRFGRVVVDNRAFAEKLVVQPLSSNNGILCGGPTLNILCP